MVLDTRVFKADLVVYLQARLDILLDQPLSRPASYAGFLQNKKLRDDKASRSITTRRLSGRYSGLFSMRIFTTSGSAKVEVSPMESVSFAAILRRIRRMIFPERVLGSASAQ